MKGEMRNGKRELKGNEAWKNDNLIMVKIRLKFDGIFKLISIFLQENEICGWKNWKINS